MDFYSFDKVRYNTSVEMRDLLSDINTDDILGVLNPIWQKRPETASRLRGRIERVLDLGVVFEDPLHRVLGERYKIGARHVFP